MQMGVKCDFLVVKNPNYRQNFIDTYTQKLVIWPTQPQTLEIREHSVRKRNFVVVIIVIAVVIVLYCIVLYCEIAFFGTFPPSSMEKYLQILFWR